MKDKLNHFADRLRGPRQQQGGSGSKLRVIAIPILVLLMLLVLIGIYWSDED